MANYVKEYKGHKVPEGATHAKEKDCGEFLFYRVGAPMVELYVEPLCSADDPWEQCLSTPSSSDELPQEPESKEWVGGLPPVGCECEVTDHWNEFERPANLKGGQKVKILMNYKCPKTGTDGVIFTWIEGSDSVRAEWTGNEKHFRPIKTQEQKDREAFIEWANKATNADGKDHTVVDLFNDLFDAGFKAPEGE